MLISPIIINSLRLDEITFKVTLSKVLKFLKRYFDPSGGR